MMEMIINIIHVMNIDSIRLLFLIVAIYWNYRIGGDMQIDDNSDEIYDGSDIK